MANKKKNKSEFEKENINFINKNKSSKRATKKSSNEEYADFDDESFTEDEMEILEEVNYSKKTYDKFVNLIKRQVNLQIAIIAQPLGSTDLLICQAVSEGLTDREITEIFGIKEDQLIMLKSNPNFITEVQKRTNDSFFGNINSRIQKMSRLGEAMFENLLDNPEKISRMSGSNQVKLIKELSDSVHKMQDDAKDKSTNLKDITVIIQEKRIDNNRIITNPDGTKKLKPMFPTLNQVIDNETGKFITEGESND